MCWGKGTGILAVVVREDLPEEVTSVMMRKCHSDDICGRRVRGSPLDLFYT